MNSKYQRVFVAVQMSRHADTARIVHGAVGSNRTTSSRLTGRLANRSADHWQKLRRITTGMTDRMVLRGLTDLPLVREVRDERDDLRSDLDGAPNSRPGASGADGGDGVEELAELVGLQQRHGSFVTFVQFVLDVTRRQHDWEGIPALAQNRHEVQAAAVRQVDVDDRDVRPVATALLRGGRDVPNPGDFEAFGGQDCTQPLADAFVIFDQQHATSAGGRALLDLRLQRSRFARGQK